MLMIVVVCESEKDKEKEGERDTHDVGGTCMRDRERNRDR